MEFLIFLIVLGYLYKGSAPDIRKSDMTKILGGIAGFIFFLSIFTSPGLLVLAGLGGIAYYLYEKYGKGAKKSHRYEKNSAPYANHKVHVDGMYANTEKTAERKSAKVKSSILPGTAKKRLKILDKFNDKYTLCLTDEEMKRIIDATYISNAWKREVEAMTEKYDSVYEWFQGDTAYLRVYLYVFHVQNISSDFGMQDQNVFQAFDEIFEYISQYKDLTVPEQILKINERYFTSFDDVTFMIAYRYLQSKGRHYDLGKSVVVSKAQAREESSMEDLMKKYDEQEQGMQRQQ